MMTSFSVLKRRYLFNYQGFAYIEFAEKESVDASMALEGSMFRGRQIKVMPKRTNKPGVSSTDRGGFRGRGRGQLQK